MRPLRTEGRAPWLFGAGLVVTLAAAIKLVLHLYAGRHYGYFVDELYYLACADHLAWGYVDQPPLIAAIAKTVRVLLGDSLPAIHLLPALAGTAKVVFDRPDRPRVGRRTLCPGIVGAVRSAGAGVSGDRQLAFDESV